MTTHSTVLSWISIASFVMIIIGFVLMVMASFTQGAAPSMGGIVLIGPIPIVLGGGTESAWLIILAAVITAIALVAFLFVRRKTYS